MHAQTDRQTDKQTDRDRQTQTHRQTHYIFINYTSKDKVMNDGSFWEDSAIFLHEVVSF